jgi:hypothetical protein
VIYLGLRERRERKRFVHNLDNARIELEKGEERLSRKLLHKHYYDLKEPAQEQVDKRLFAGMSWGKFKRARN